MRKQIDNRIRILIENGVKTQHRTFFVILGDKARDQIVLLHHMLHKAAPKGRPSVLWCYKKDLGFSTHRKKRMKQIQHKLKSGSSEIREEDPFDLFISSTKIRFCYYAETHKILGNTYGMCILQDFEPLTPNLLARTIETVEGGGLVVLLLRSLDSLKQLYNLNMDIHRHFRTEAHQNVVCRFNERFLLSLASCRRCLVIDDQLNILPITSRNVRVTPVENAVQLSENEEQLMDLKTKTRDTQMVGALVNCCKTLDQGNALLKFLEAITEKSLRTTVSLTAARGRGKSAALGLAVAAAVAFGYSNVFVTSPSPENLNTFFEFICKGFDALEYEEHTDYTLTQSTNPEFNKAIVRIEINRDHRQTIQYIHPTDGDKLFQAELLVIDEAAAIPLPYVKAMLGPYLIFLASTINGYEGTGRSLSLKLLQQLRVQVVPSANSIAASKTSATGRTLHEITLKESIRYKPGDDVEAWLNKLLCLDATTVIPLSSKCPSPEVCKLYYINRDTLFSYHVASEEFLQRLVSLYVSSHYKNSPNDLQMMSDAPAHHLFCLLGPVDPKQETLPEVLVVIQICLEGNISKNSTVEASKSGQLPSGDLIPWTVSQQFRDPNFTGLCGARIVRIATHPDFQGMGYGKKALELLRQYYEFKCLSIDEDEENSTKEDDSSDEEETNLLSETIAPRKSLPPLLLKLSQRPPEKLTYLGVSYGLTESLLKFWKRADFIPVYIRQTTNDITGEHSCIMLNVLKSEESIEDEEEQFKKGVDDWLLDYWADFKGRFMRLLSREFSKFPTALAYGVLVNKTVKEKNGNLSPEEMYTYLTKRDIFRLKDYINQIVDYHYILDLVQTIAKLYFNGKMDNVKLGPLESAILLGMGLQHKSVETVSTELDLPVATILSKFKKAIKDIHRYLNSLLEQSIINNLETKENPSSSTSLNTSLKTAKPDQEVQTVNKAKEKEKFKHLDLSQYAIKGSEQEWINSLSSLSGSKNVLSIKTGEKRLKNLNNSDATLEPQKKKKKFNKKKQNRKSM